MKAVVHDRYGPPEVLRIETLERPVPGGRRGARQGPRDNGHAHRHRPPKRRVLHQPLRDRPPPAEAEESSASSSPARSSGSGASVSEFAVGDRVFGVRTGAYAEYVAIPETGALALMPAGLTFEEAAAVCDGAALALSCFRKAGALDGRRVLVYGASGSVGTAGVQLAKHFGAHVTAVCNTKNVELVRSLGADVVVDYTQEDFTRNGETYDVVFDAVGKTSFRRCRRSLNPAASTSRPTSASCGTSRCSQSATRWVGSKRVGARDHGVPEGGRLQLLEAAHRERGVPAGLDRTYLLDDVVEASKYVETGQKTGNVVFTIGGAGAQGADS